VQVFAELAPEAVEHEFGSSFPSGIFLDHGGVESDPFFLLVLVDVARFVFGGVAPGRVASRFLLDFEPSVDVIGEETLLLFFEVPDFVDLLDDVTLLDGFAEFGDTPGPAQHALVVGMGAMVQLVVKRFGHLFFHAGAAEWESEFAVATKG